MIMTAIAAAWRIVTRRPLAWLGALVLVAACSTYLGGLSDAGYSVVTAFLLVEGVIGGLAAERSARPGALRVAGAAAATYAAGLVAGGGAALVMLTMFALASAALMIVAGVCAAVAFSSLMAATFGLWLPAMLSRHPHPFAEAAVRVVGAWRGLFVGVALILAAATALRLVALVGAEAAASVALAAPATHLTPWFARGLMFSDAVLKLAIDGFAHLAVGALLATAWRARDSADAAPAAA